MTRGELIAELAASLGARHEARFIVEEVLGSPPSRRTRQVGPADVDASPYPGGAAGERGEPLQYVLGHWAFRSLDLLVDRRVLIPRPETEQVVEVALGELGGSVTAAPTIVDAGTGSGAIALSLATELADRCPEGRLWATEASLRRWRWRGRIWSGSRTASSDGHVLPVTLVQGSWLDPLPRRCGAGRSGRRQSALRRRRDVAGSPRGGAARALRGAGGRSPVPTARPGSGMSRRCCRRRGPGWRVPARW